MSDLHIRDIPDDLHEKMKLAAAIEKATIKDFMIWALTKAADESIHAFKAEGKVRPESVAYDAKTEVIPTTAKRKK